jgi:hypothetical protein
VTSSARDLMTLEEIDRVIAAWDERLAQVDRNLIDLHDADYPLIEASASRFTGLTGKRVGPAVTAMRALFDQRKTLGDVIDRARAVRAGLSRIWPSRAHLEEISDLLRGSAVVLDSAPTPIAERGLLSPADQARRVTLDGALATMAQEYDLVRTATTDVTRAWQRVNPAIDAFNLKYGALVELARHVGASADPDVLGLRAETDALRDRVAADPLAVAAELDTTVQPRLRELGDRLERLTKTRTELQTRLSDARTRLTALEAASANASATLAEAQARILDPAGLVGSCSDEDLAELRSWLAKLEETVTAGRWQAASVGLARFDQTVRGRLDDEERAAAANHLIADAPDELIGRLAARRGQLLQLRARGVSIPPDLEQEADALATLLAQSPLPLVQATTLLARFEERLRALGR